MNTTNVTSNNVSIESFIPAILQAFLFIIIVALKFFNEKKLNGFLKNFFDEYNRRNSVFVEEVTKTIEKTNSEKSITPQLTNREVHESTCPYPSPNANLQPIYLDNIGKKLMLGDYVISIENNTPR